MMDAKSTRHMGRGRWLRAGFALFLAVVTSVVFIAGSPAPVNAADVAVTIDNFAFAPGTITVPVGTRVVWTNQQVLVTHTVTSDTGDTTTWDSGALTMGQTFAFTFTTPGTFPYHCNFHLSMHGTVIVQAPAATATPIPQPVGHSAGPVATSAPAMTVAPALQPVVHLVSTATGAPPSAPLVQPARH